MSSKISLCASITGHLGLRNEIKLVLSSFVIAVLLGFTQVPIAEGAVSWNGFLKQVGFNPPTIYEVSDTTVLPAGETRSEFVTLLCKEGDWMQVSDRGSEEWSVSMITNPHLSQTEVFLSVQNIHEDGDIYSKIIGVHFVNLNAISAKSFDVEATLTILCLSPSSMMSVGGEWIATDTTALIIGYSVLNAYWIAPIGIGIGVGIYLVKRKIE